MAGRSENSNADCSLSLNNQKVIQDAVDDALKAISLPDGGKQQKIQTRNRNDDTIGNVVKQVLTELMPTVGKLIATAVQAATEPLLEKLSELGTVDLHDEAKQKIQSAFQRQKLEIDRLEQYSRRDSIRISGVPEERQENTNEKVIKVVSDLGLSIQPSDISVSHRLGPYNGNSNNVRPRPIIAKFVRRDIKTQICRNKKKIKNVQGRENVFIDEDLTPLRFRLVKELRKEPGRTVWTIDGRIFTKISRDGEEDKRTLENTEDFLDLGWSKEKLNDLGLAVDI